MSGEMMDYPENIDSFLDRYSFPDIKKVYTNGVDLIPVFRVKQAIEKYMSNMKEEKRRNINING